MGGGRGSGSGSGGGPVLTSGCAWQVGGCWACDGRGTVRWGGKAKRADQVFALEEGVRAVGG